MTLSTELKPCPFCLKNLKVYAAKHNPMAVCETEGCWLAERRIAVPCDDPYSTAAWNTRAAPDVPKLERYRPTKYGEACLGGVHQDPNGEYVRYDQHEAVVAAERGEKHRAQKAVLELDQRNKQIPLGYITPKAQLSLLQEFSSSDSISPVKMGECCVAIYDAPVASNAELRIAELQTINKQYAEIASKAVKFEITERLFVESRGLNKWAVSRGGASVLNTDGEWEWEPIPSQRDDEFIERTRFNFSEAWTRAHALPSAAVTD